MKCSTVTDTQSSADRQTRLSTRLGPPSDTMWPGPRSICMLSFILIRLTVATIHERYRQTGQAEQYRQRSDSIQSIGRTVLQPKGRPRPKNYWISLLRAALTVVGFVLCYIFYAQVVGLFTFLFYLCICKFYLCSASVTFALSCMHLCHSVIQIINSVVSF